LQSLCQIVDAYPVMVVTYLVMYMIVVKIVDAYPEI
jgi:hypothetical protein